MSTRLFTIASTIVALASALPVFGQTKDKQPDGVPKDKTPSASTENVSGLVTAQIATLKGHMCRNSCTTWMPADFISPDGRYLYVQTPGQEKAELRSVPDLKVLTVFSGPGFTFPEMDRVDQLGVAYNPHLDMVATTSHAQAKQGSNFGEGTKLWSLPGMKLQTILRAGRDRVFSTDGRFLAATETGDLGGVGIWNVRDGSFKRLPTERYSVLGFCPTGSFLLTQGVMTAEEMESTAELKRLRDQYRKADAGDLPKVSIWSALDGKLVTNPPGARGLAGFSPDGRRVACFGPIGGVQLWSIPEGKLLASFGDDSETPFTPGNSESPLFFGTSSADGRYIAYGSKKSTRIWSVWEGKLVTTLESTSKIGSHMTFSPDGRILATWPEAAGCRLWSVPTGKLITTLGDGWGYHVSFSPDGRTLVTSSVSGSTALWVYAPGEKLDWSLDKAVPGHQPRVEVTLTKSASVYAGDKVSLDLTVRNRGDVDMMQLWAGAEADSPQIRRLTCLIGRVKPDTIIERPIRVVLPAEHKAGKFKGTLVFHEGKDKGNAPAALPFVIEVKPLPRPDFALTMKPDGLNSKNSTIHLKRGNTLELSGSIKNQTGNGIAHLRVSLQVVEGYERVSVTSGLAELGLVPNDGNAEGRVVFQAKRDATAGGATFELRAEDAEGRVFAMQRFVVPID